MRLDVYDIPLRIARRKIQEVDIPAAANLNKACAIRKFNNEKNIAHSGFIALPKAPCKLSWHSRRCFDNKRDFVGVNPVPIQSPLSL